MLLRRRLATSFASAAALFILVPGCDAEDPGAVADLTTKASFAKNDPIRRACDMHPDMIIRTWRGIDAKRSEDVIIVPQEPNYQGTFTRGSHTGPWDYVQDVPLVFYGPGNIPSLPAVERHATLADVYPTVGRLLDVPFPEREGRILSQVVSSNPDPPRLLVGVIWDGGGDNVLERWPHAWPNLKRLMREGVYYSDATVGSSPSVTPPAHANLSTGSFPRDSGIAGIHHRNANGGVHRVFEGADPREMQLSTFADDVDQHFGNASKVGLLAWQIAALKTTDPTQTSNHLSMLGSGTALDGGDRDEVALIGHHADVISNDRFFTLPSYLVDFPTLEDRIDELDKRDGEADGLWLGHEIATSHDNPAWVALQTDMIEAMFERSGYGADDIPDVFLTNFKASDLVGHRYSMDSEEMRQVIEAQDKALGDLVELLDDKVGDYVMVISADHGHTPSSKRTGAWAMDNQELEKDIDAHFDVPEGRSLSQCCSVGGIFLDPAVKSEIGVSDGEVARFVNAYTIRENWKGRLPQDFRDRGSEPIFNAAFPSSKIDGIMRCAFGRPTPPPDVPA